MGNSPTPLSQAQQLPIHPSFPNPMVRSQNQHKHMVIHMLFTQQKLNDWIIKKTTYKRMIKKSRHLFWPLDLEFKRVGFCSAAGTLQLCYPYCPVTLKQQICNRSKSNIIFKQKQVWYLAYSLISLCEQVHQYNENIGDIRPINILLTQHGEIKVISKFSIPNENQSVDKTAQLSIPSFLSPEMLQQVHNCQNEDVSLSLSSQCFSVGLTLLVTCILRLGQQMYRPTKKFHKDILRQYIRQLDEQTIYSQALKFIIKGLCQYNQKNRFTIYQVYKCLNPYKNKIYSLSDFQINHFTESMDRKMEEYNQQQVNGQFQAKSQRSQKKINPRQLLFQVFQKQKQQSQASHQIKQKKKTKEINQSLPHYISTNILNKGKRHTKNQQIILQNLNTQISQTYDIEQTIDKNILTKQQRNVNPQIKQKLFTPYKLLTSQNFTAADQKFKQSRSTQLGLSKQTSRGISKQFMVFSKQSSMTPQKKRWPQFDTNSLSQLNVHSPINYQLHKSHYFQDVKENQSFLEQIQQIQIKKQSYNFDQNVQLRQFTSNKYKPKNKYISRQLHNNSKSVSFNGVHFLNDQ